MEPVRVGIAHRFLAGLVDTIVLAVLVAVPNVVLSKVSPMLATMVAPGPSRASCTNPRADRSPPIKTGSP